MLVEHIERLILKLNISIMAENEKNEKAVKKGSKCLSLLSSNTPVTRTLASSSVFFTPPYSGGSSSEDRSRRAPFFPRETGAIPLDFGIEFNEEYRFDIIGKLYEGSVHTVFKTIFNYLDDLSLFRATLVCRKWRNIIQNVEHTSKTRVFDFVSRKRRYCEEKGKENVGQQKMLHELAQPILEITPSSASKMPKKEMSSYRYRPCPKCNSPAKILDTHKSTCEGCNETFCVDCFRTIEAHNEGACPNIRTEANVTPKRKKNSRNYIGSKKSKDRLRRLSLQKR